jgi:SH3 domain-containing protein
MLCLACAASLPAHCDDRAAAVGKQRAASSTLQWSVGELDHPRMGPIRVAVPRIPIATSVGKDRIVSLVFLSCEKTRRTIAIEFANASEADSQGGLRPRDMPQLICNTPLAQSGYAMRQSDLAARWEVSAVGDALARGLSPSALRRCASINVVQEVALPKGWSQDSQRIEFELTPYGRELDSVFVACGETTAFASSAAKPDVAWKPARTTSKGKTNVRASPGLDSAVVVQLAPNEKVLVQSTSTEWWKVKPRTGEAFNGYIRKDRFTFD